MMKSLWLLHQVTGDPRCQFWGWHMMNAFHKLLQAEVWECFNSEGVSVVSIDVDDADRPSHRFFLNCFKTANSHLCWCELILLLQ